MNTSYCDLRIKTEVRAVDRLRLALAEVQSSKGVSDDYLGFNREVANGSWSSDVAFRGRFAATSTPIRRLG